MAEEKNDPIGALHTDITWIKTTLKDIQTDIKDIREFHQQIGERVSALEQRMSFHDKILYLIIGGGITGFISMILWVISAIP